MRPAIPAQSWRVAGREVSPFRACGLTGLAAATTVALGVTAAHGASVAAEAGVVALALAVFVALALFTKAATGRDRLIYYHHEIAVLATASAAVALAGGPVREHFDATALGLGAFLACGRIGCLTVGCCHGRPARRGIRYASGHAIVPSYLAGTTLVPVQALEAAAVAALAAAGVIAVLAGAPAGSAGALCVSGYALLRFGLEALRGDPGRRSVRGLSEAQWTSVGLAAAVAAAGWAGWLPAAAWHAAAAALLALAAAVIAVRGAPPRRLLDPRHVDELRRALVRAPTARPGAAIGVRRTSLGIGLSHGLVDGRDHYALSGPRLSDQRAADLARAILWLRHRGHDGELVAGPAGVYHVLVR